MQTLQGLLGGFDHPWWRGLDVPWPVTARAGGFDPAQVQAELVLEALRESDRATWLTGLAHPATGLRFELRWRWWHDTQTLELTGALANRGSRPLEHVAPPKPLAWVWHLPEFGQGWLRTVTGGSWIDVTFPPAGLTVQDAQLVAQRQSWRPVELFAENGLPTHRHLPVMALADERQTHGVVAALEWCGNWRMRLRPWPCHPHQGAPDFWDSVTPMPWLALQGGYEPLDVTLQPGQSVPLPRSLMTFYTGDLDAGCNLFRRHLRDHAAPALDGRPVTPPVSFNSWIGYRIEQFDDAAARAEAEVCGPLGIEYLCFDAGWYAGGFRGGNGNWDRPDLAKLPHGVRSLAEHVERCGLKYGTWVEPEFVHETSDLARAHPDWLLRLPGQPMGLLDFGLEAVRSWWVDWFQRVRRDWGVRWIRWDMNQAPQPYWAHEEPAGEVGLRQIRHVEGLYQTLDAVLAACPDLLIEGCAGGGTRLEPGLLRRCHTYWINDQSSSPHFVRHYQHGANTFYPAHYANLNIALGGCPATESAWLSHFNGPLGFNERLSTWSAEALAHTAQQVQRYKHLRHLLHEDFLPAGPQPQRLEGWHALAFGNQEAGVRFVHRLHSADLDVQYRDRPYRFSTEVDAIIETWGTWES